MGYVIRNTISTIYFYIATILHAEYWLPGRPTFLCNTLQYIGRLKKKSNGKGKTYSTLKIKEEQCLAVLFIDWSKSNSKFSLHDLFNLSGFSMVNWSIVSSAFSKIYMHYAFLLIQQDASACWGHLGILGNVMTMANSQYCSQGSTEVWCFQHVIFGIKLHLVNLISKLFTHSAQFLIFLYDFVLSIFWLFKYCCTLVFMILFVSSMGHSSPSITPSWR